MSSPTPCPTCGAPLTAVCLTCRGRRGGMAKSPRKVEASRVNVQKAIEARKNHVKPGHGQG